MDFIRHSHFPHTMCEQKAVCPLSGHLCGSGISGYHSYPLGQQNPAREPWMCQWRTAETSLCQPDQRNAVLARTTGSMWNKERSGVQCQEFCFCSKTMTNLDPPEKNKWRISKKYIYKDNLVSERDPFQRGFCRNNMMSSGIFQHHPIRSLHCLSRWKINRHLPGTRKPYLDGVGLILVILRIGFQVININGR